MKTRTKMNLMMAASLVVMLNFSSCGKYEDGPNFSLRTKKARLIGTWEIDKINGTPLAPEEVEIEFEEDGDLKWLYFDPGYGTTQYFGEWEFSSDKEELEITLDGDRVDWEILRLTKDDLWFEWDNEEIKMKKK